MVVFLILNKRELLRKLTNSELVEIVYINHNMWLLQVARNFTQDEDKSLDLVQELYLYLMQMKDIEKIRYNNTVNLFYLYKVIKSKFLNGIKQDKKMIVLPVEEDYLEIGEEEYSLDRDEKFEYMLKQTKHLLETEVHWFDEKLLMTYITEEHSIASLHKATGISKSSIWTSLNKTKTFIRNSYDDSQR